jgi:hypothetical protein
VQWQYRIMAAFFVKGLKTLHQMHENIVCSEYLFIEKDTCSIIVTYKLFQADDIIEQ